MGVDTLDVAMPTLTRLPCAVDVLAAVLTLAGLSIPPLLLSHGFRVLNGAGVAAHLLRLLLARAPLLTLMLKKRRGSKQVGCAWTKQKQKQQ